MTNIFNPHFSKIHILKSMIIVRGIIHVIPSKQSTKLQSSRAIGQCESKFCGLYEKSYISTESKMSTYSWFFQ
jgi:hypothetical protein